MIRIEIQGEHAVAHGPFPFPFVAVLSKLGGRKIWNGRTSVRFEATPGNMRALRENKDFKLEFDDQSGVLAAMDELSQLATQHQAIKLNIDYTPKVALRDYQQRALALCADRAAYALLLEMGLGKTAIAIANAGKLFIEGKITGLLVVAPKGVESQWIEEELPKHLDARVQWRGLQWKKKRMKASEMIGDGRLMVLAMNTDAIRTEIGEETARTFLTMHAGRCMFVFDESHDIKSNKAARTKAAWRLAERATFRRIMTGTLITKNLVDAWAQFKFLNWKILGFKQMTAFRAHFCIMDPDYKGKVLAAQNVEEFYSLIAPHSFRLTKAEALPDLPPKQYIEKPYRMDDETRRKYKELRDTLMLFLEDGTIIDAKTALVGLLRLQQIVCGYIPADDGDEKRMIEFNQQRLDIMQDVCEQTSGPTVIWARFKEDMRRIERRLREGYAAKEIVTYYGETSDADREHAKRAFLSGASRFFVSNPSSGGVGLNLQGECSTVIYYSNSFTALHRWQSEDRTHRIGTLNKVSYFDLVCRGTVDRAILNNLAAKKGLADLSLDQIRQAIYAPLQD